MKLFARLSRQVRSKKPHSAASSAGIASRLVLSCVRIVEAGFACPPESAFPNRPGASSPGRAPRRPALPPTWLERRASILSCSIVAPVLRSSRWRSIDPRAFQRSREGSPVRRRRALSPLAGVDHVPAGTFRLWFSRRIRKYSSSQASCATPLL